MAVGDVEAVVLVLQRVDVAYFEVDVVQLGGDGEFASLLDHLGHDIDADDLAVGDAAGEADGDAAGAAAEIEDAHCGGEPGQEEGGGLFDGPPPVLIDHGSVVAVCVAIALVRIRHRTILGGGWARRFRVPLNCC